MSESFLQQLLSLPTVLYGDLSPDGRWVAFVWYRLHENMDVFFVPSDGSQPPAALTHTPEATRFLRWTNDSQAVVVAQDHSHDEHDRLCLVRLAEPLVMQPLTDDQHDYFVRGGSLNPDGRMLYYGANYDFASGKTIEPTWIYRHDLVTGERVPIATPRLPASTVPTLNRLGTHVLYGRKDRHPSGYQMHLVGVEGDDDRECLNFGDAVKAFGSWMADGEHVLALSESRDDGPRSHRSVGVYHIGTREMRWLLDDATRNIEGVRATRDGLIIVDEVRAARHLTSFLDPVMNTETALPLLPGNLLPLGRSDDGAWIGLYYASTLPTELVRFMAGARTPADLVSLTRVWERTTLDPTWLVAAEEFHWRAPDGLALQGWLYRAQPNRQRAIVFVHGGPSAHSEDRLNPELQYFVARGFNVLDVNYRGSTGFGLPFRELIKEDGWGGREQEDVASGARALIETGLGAPGRIGVTGTSYGGYSSWCQITRYPRDLIAAAAPICGMTDLVVDYQTTRPDLRPYSEEMLGGSPAQAPERYRERSPINFVQNIRGKLLIVQGAQDPNVTPANVREVVARLETNRIAYELLVFEDEGHGVAKPANQHTLYIRLADFFDRALNRA
jgi:dipeptidyl aminopeptidase/acylaminoacyl peptidase